MNELAYKAAKETLDAASDKFESHIKTTVIPETVDKCMSNMGVDVKNPQEVQADNLWVRSQRQKSEKFQEYKMRAVISGVVGVVIAALVAYFKG